MSVERVVCAAALAGALVFACRSASSDQRDDGAPIVIGNVTIDKAGVAIKDAMGSVTMTTRDGLVVTNALGMKIALNHEGIVVTGMGASAALTAVGGASLELTSGSAKAEIHALRSSAALSLDATADSKILVDAEGPAATVMATSGDASASMMTIRDKDATIGASFAKHGAIMTANATKAHASSDN